MKPTVGRIVHYEDPEIGTIAAVITAVHEGGVNLTTFTPGKPCGYVAVGPGNLLAVVAFAETPTPGHWNWPPRV